MVDVDNVDDVVVDVEDDVVEDCVHCSQNAGHLSRTSSPNSSEMQACFNSIPAIQEVGSGMPLHTFVESTVLTLVDVVVLDCVEPIVLVSKDVLTPVTSVLLLSVVMFCVVPFDVVCEVEEQVSHRIGHLSRTDKTVSQMNGLKNTQSEFCKTPLQKSNETVDELDVEDELEVVLELELVVVDVELTLVVVEEALVLVSVLVDSVDELEEDEVVEVFVDVNEVVEVVVDDKVVVDVVVDETVIEVADCVLEE